MSLQDSLDFLGRPGAAVRSGLKGNVGGVARQLGQIPLDLIDAALPGDLIPNITKPEDNPEFTDVLEYWGLPKMQGGLTKSAVDILGGIATDPLTFVPASWVAKGAKAAGAGALAGAKAADKFLPATEPLFEPALRSARNTVADTFNWSSMSPDQAASLARVQGTRSAQVAADDATQAGILAGFSPDVKRVAVQAIQNVKETPIPGAASRLDKIVPGAYEGGFWQGPADWQAEVSTVASKHPDVVSGAVKQADVDRAIEAILKPGAAHGDALFESRFFQAPALVTHPVTGGKPMPLLRAHEQALKSGVLAPGSTPGDFLHLPGVSYVPQKGLSPHPYLARAYTDDMASAGLLDPAMSSVANSAKARGTLDDALMGANVNERTLIADPDALLAQGNAFVAQGIAKQKVIKELQPYVLKDVDQEIAALDKRMRELAGSGAPQAELDAIANAKAASNELRTKLRTNPRYLDDAVRTATTDTIAKMKAGTDFGARDLAVRMEVMLNGMPKRSALMDTFSKWSTTAFKKPATVGLGLPNTAFTPRNRISAVAQAMAGANARGANFVTMWNDPAVRAALNPTTAMNDVRAVIDELVGGYAQAMNGKITPAHVGVARDATDEALRAIATGIKVGGGNSLEAMRAIRGSNAYAAEALENGVLGGFSSHDEMLSALTSDPAQAKARFKSFLDSPAKANEALENRMRLNFFIAQRKAGMSPSEAAAAVRHDLLDYTQATPQNRLARDIFPFFAFLSQSIPQTLASPIAMSSAVQVLGNQPDEPLMPNMKDKVNISLGADAQGNAKYLTSLGLPIESLGQIPTGQEDALAKLAGMSHPFLRTSIGWATGEDPVFNSPFGSYDKNPLLFQAAGADPNSELGKAWAALNQAGVTTFASPVLRPAQTLLDDRLTAGEKASRLLTGARVQSVDPVRAEQATIRDALRWNPDIRQSVNYYTTGGDPETIQMLEEFKQASKALREKIKAEKAAAGK